MRTLAILTAAAISSSCGVVANDSAMTTVLEPLMTNHAASLGSDDVSEMRRTGRILIATFDAAALRQ